MTFSFLSKCFIKEPHLSANHFLWCKLEGLSLSTLLRGIFLRHQMVDSFQHLRKNMEILLVEYQYANWSIFWTRLQLIRVLSQFRDRSPPLIIELKCNRLKCRYSGASESFLVSFTIFIKDGSWNLSKTKHSQCRWGLLLEALFGIIGLAQTAL